MIDVKTTILETIKDKIKKLKYLGDNDTKGFKKILSLIILDDLCEWSDYLDVPQSIQDKLKDMKTKFILCHRDFKISYNPIEYQKDDSVDNYFVINEKFKNSYDPVGGYYINVNTPQTNYTWKRVWDNPDGYLTIDEDVEIPNYIQLTELSPTGNYLYLDEIPLIDEEYIPIVETEVNQEGYLYE